MTTAIWKFELAHGTTPVTIPTGAEPLTVGHDPGGDLCLWAAVDPYAEQVERVFEVVGTGHDLDATPLETAARYIGTVKEGPFIWHVLDYGEPGLAAWGDADAKENPRD